MTELLTIQRPKRWDTPFDSHMNEADVDGLMASPPFDTIRNDSFPRTASLRDILLNDARIVTFRRGDIVIRRGDYGNAVFFVLRGSVRVLLDPEAENHLGDDTAYSKRSIFGALSQLWRKSDAPEARNVTTYQLQEGLGLRTDADGAARTFVDNIDDFVAKYRTVALGEGHMFGEIGAMSRTPRTATVFADSETEILEMRWQGLREVRRHSGSFREHTDKLYRERSLGMHLAESPLFANLSEDVLAEIAASTLFESYGEFEWFGSFKRVRGTDEAIEHEPVIAEEGHYADGLIMVRAGFARVSNVQGHGWRTVSYLAQNEVFGLSELYDHWRDGSEPALRHRLSAIGYVDVLRVPASLVERYVSNLTPEVLKACGAATETSVSGKPVSSRWSISWSIIESSTARQPC